MPPSHVLFEAVPVKTLNQLDIVAFLLFLGKSLSRKETETNTFDFDTMIALAVFKFFCLLTKFDYV